MKRTKLDKKLQLIKTKIRPLSTDELSNATGGAAEYTYASAARPCWMCYTSKNC